MNRPRFLADHNFRQPIPSGLHRLEPAIEIILAREVGLDRAPDEIVLTRAATEGWIVLTHDRKTLIPLAIQLIKTGEPMNGLILAKPDRQHRQQVQEELVMIWACTEENEWKNRIENLPF